MNQHTLKERNLELAALDDTIDFILKEEQSEPMVLYTGYNDGGYAEFRGLKPYLDPRAEVFVIENNKKDDVLKEYYELETGRLHYKDFLDKYQFTHLILTEYDSLYVNMLKDSDYYLAYANEEYALFETIGEKTGD